MKKYKSRPIAFAVLVMLCFMAQFAASCSDDDTFSANPNNHLTFAVDTVKMDTVFSRIPAPAKTFWIYNNSWDGIKCSKVYLEKGNQTGFRVNVDGVYLGDKTGYQTADVEVRKGDSIRVFVEVTAPANGTQLYKEIDDNLVFMLESGNVQKVALKAFSWNAEVVNKLTLTRDTIIDNGQSGNAIVIYDTLRVDSGVTLTIKAGTTLHFHDNAIIDVYGKLICEGTADKNVVLRCDRLDNMFDYLPFDNVSGRWKGIRFRKTSYGNTMAYTDLHGSCDGILCDSSDVSRQKLTLSSSTVHNCKGYGVKTCNSRVDLLNCQITNALKDCVSVQGGDVNIVHCTIGQFYGFSANRGVAFRFTNTDGKYALPLKNMSVVNSIVTGYADDEIMGENPDTTAVFKYYFSHSLLRTPEITDTAMLAVFDSIRWESAKDTMQLGKKNFLKIDIDQLCYDFHLDSLSRANGSADTRYMIQYNRDGVMRDPKKVNMGCY